MMLTLHTPHYPNTHNTHQHRLIFSPLALASASGSRPCKRTYVHARACARLLGSAPPQTDHLIPIHPHSRCLQEQSALTVRSAQEGGSEGDASKLPMLLDVETRGGILFVSTLGTLGVFGLYKLVVAAGVDSLQAGALCVGGLTAFLSPPSIHPCMHPTD